MVIIINLGMYNAAAGLEILTQRILWSLLIRTMTCTDILSESGGNRPSRKSPLFQ